MRTILSFFAISMLLTFPFRLLGQSSCGWESQEMAVPCFGAGCTGSAITWLCSGTGSNKCVTSTKPCEEGGSCMTYSSATCTVGTRNYQNYQYPKTKADLEALVRASSQRSCMKQAAMPEKRLQDVILDQRADLGSSR
jgi:hypothetical protein